MSAQSKRLVRWWKLGVDKELRVRGRWVLVMPLLYRQATLRHFNVWCAQRPPYGIMHEYPTCGETSNASRERSAQQIHNTTKRAPSLMPERFTVE